MSRGLNEVQDLPSAKRTHIYTFPLFDLSNDGLCEGSSVTAIHRPSQPMSTGEKGYVQTAY